MAEGEGELVPQLSTVETPKDMEVVQWRADQRQGFGRNVPIRPALDRAGAVDMAALHPFPAAVLDDLKGTSAAASRKMTKEERELMLYKRKLRNRESARRSRLRKQARQTNPEKDDEAEDSTPPPKERKNEPVVKTKPASAGEQRSARASRRNAAAEKTKNDSSDDGDGSYEPPRSSLRDLAELVVRLRANGDANRNDAEGRGSRPH